MDKKRLVILSDYGLDDAVALAWLYNHRDNFSGIDVVAVGGNVSKERSLKNAAKLIYELKKENDYDIRLVSTNSAEQSEEDLPSIHGKDGMGDLFRNKKCYEKVEAAQLDEYLKTLKDGFILVSLGPLTITKTLLNGFKPFSTLIMAGVVDEQPNYKSLEFNQALDVSAFNECVGFPHEIATLDTCRQAAFNLAGHRFKECCVLNKLINRSIKLAEKRHKDNCYIYDFIAVLRLTNPLIFKTQRVNDRSGNALNELSVSGQVENFHISSLILSNKT